MIETEPVIALLTDFGLRDYFVAAMKGVILSVNSKIKIVDITHDIAPHDVSQASFVLRACFENFPPQTVFVAVVDPGVGSERRAILVQTDKYYFVAPDNGLLDFIFNSTKGFKVYELTEEVFFNHPVSRTFHGRDIFAPCAAHLAKGERTEDFGAEILDFVTVGEIAPRKTEEGEIIGKIIHIDHFGNLITNLKREDLPETFVIKINGKIIGNLQEFFAGAEKGELILVYGSAGFLEIAASNASAEKILNVEAGQDIVVLTM